MSVLVARMELLIEVEVGDDTVILLAEITGVVGLIRCRPCKVCRLE